MLIKAVTQAILTYMMSVFKFPAGLCQSIQLAINRFWWGHSQDEKKIHWIKGVTLKRKDDRPWFSRDGCIQLDTTGKMILAHCTR